MLIKALQENESYSLNTCLTFAISMGAFVIVKLSTADGLPVLVLADHQTEMRIY